MEPVFSYRWIQSPIHPFNNTLFMGCCIEAKPTYTKVKEPKPLEMTLLKPPQVILLKRRLPKAEVIQERQPPPSTNPLPEALLIYIPSTQASVLRKFQPQPYPLRTTASPMKIRRDPIIQTKQVSQSVYLAPSDAKCWSIIDTEDVPERLAVPPIWM